MAKIVKGARFVSKYTNTSNSKPTIPNNNSSDYLNDDHTTGWNNTDIYVGEWFFNLYDSKAYFRTTNGIYQVVTIKAVETDGTPILSTAADSKISTDYLPGNYMGAMLYKGTWDASSGLQPGVEYDEDYTPKNGDYYVVRTDGDTALSSYFGDITDWKAGDFAVFTLTRQGWEKVDNTERQETASTVIYDTMFGGRTTQYYDELSSVNNYIEVQKVLDNIYENLYLNPIFKNPSTFNENVLISEKDNGDGTYGTITEPLLNLKRLTTTSNKYIYLDGTYNDKWITFNGETNNTGTLKIGTEGLTNTVIEFGPYGYTSNSLASTVNYNYSSSLTRTKRWNIYSSSTDGYIKGYDNNGTTEIIKLSTKDNSFISKKLAVGIGVNNDIADLQVNSNNAITNLAISRTNTAISSGLNVGKLSFNSSTSQSTYVEYSNITSKIGTTTTYSSLIFKVKGPSGTLAEGLSLIGNVSGFYLGVNKGGDTPNAPLDVTGNAIISGELTLGADNLTHTINGNVNISQNLNTYGTLISTKDNDSVVFQLEDSTESKFKVKWFSGYNKLTLNGYTDISNLEYNAVTGNITLRTGNLYLEDTDLTFSTQSRTVDFNYALVKNTIVDNMSFNNIVSYNNSYIFDNFNGDDLITKNAVLEYYVSHPAGLWVSDGTVDKIFAYDSNITKFVGINTDNPIYNLDVYGNVRFTDTLNATDIVLESDLQERFLRTDVYGGAIRFRGNSSSTTDRNLKFGSVDNSGVFTNVLTLDTDTHNVSIGGDTINTDTYKLHVGGTLRASSTIYAGNMSIGNLNITPYTVGLHVEGKTKLNSNVGIGGDADDTYILNVTGDTLFQGEVDVLDYLYVATTKSISDTYNFKVNGTSYFNDTVSINGSNSNTILYAGGNAYVNRLNINSINNFTTYSLYVNGKSYFINEMGIGTPSDANFKLNVLGNVKLNGTVRTDSVVSISNSAYFLKLNDTTTSINVPGSIKGKSLYINGVGATYRSSVEISQVGFAYSGTQAAGILISDNSEHWGIGIDSYNYMYFMNSSSGFDGHGSVFSIDDNGITVPGYSNLLSNVGIGTTAVSTYKLKVGGTSYFTDNVGIGTAVDSDYKLKVNGNTYITSLFDGITVANPIILDQDALTATLTYDVRTMTNNNVQIISNVYYNSNHTITIVIDNSYNKPIQGRKFNFKLFYNVYNVGNIDGVIEVYYKWNNIVDGVVLELIANKSYGGVKDTYQNVNIDISILDNNVNYSNNSQSVIYNLLCQTDMKFYKYNGIDKYYKVPLELQWIVPLQK